MPYIKKERRAAIIKRDSHQAAQIGVSKIETVGELCYVLNFLLNHYAYKRSKGSDGLRFQTVAEIAGAVKVAYDEFNRSAVGMSEANSEENNGAVADDFAKTNPYHFVGASNDDD